MLYTSNLPSPASLRYAAGIAAISGAGQRSVFTRVANMATYPNQFIILVADPAVGKSVVARVVEEMWVDTKLLHVSPHNASREGLLDALSEAKQTVNGEEFHSLQIFASEFANLINKHDVGFLAQMSEIYDCPAAHNEKKRKHNGQSHDILKPQMNMLACVTPSTFATIMPPEAYGQGIASRLLLVYAYERIKVNIFEEAADNKSTYQLLVRDLASIARTHGEMTWSPEAQELLIDFYMVKMDKTALLHPRLDGYNGRRLPHLIKNCMVQSLSDSNDLVITAEHFNKAIAFMAGVEDKLPDAMSNITKTSHEDLIKQCHAFICDAWLRNGRKKPILHHTLVAYLGARMDAYKVNHTIEIMVRGNVLKQVRQMVNGKVYENGWVGYEPVLNSQEAQQLFEQGD